MHNIYPCIMDVKNSVQNKVIFQGAAVHLQGVQHCHPAQTQGTACPRSLDPNYLVTYYIKWVKTSRTDTLPSRHTCDSDPHFELWIRILGLHNHFIGEVQNAKFNIQKCASIQCFQFCSGFFFIQTLLIHGSCII